jgi:hypothetical protein
MAALPYGYQSIFYSARFSPDYRRRHYRLVTDQRSGSATQAVVVKSANGDKNGITTIRDIPVDPGALYLMAGWIRVTEGSEGYLGGVWRDRAGDDVQYWYVARNLTTKSWQMAASVAAVPQNAVSFTPLMLNMGKGNAYFDNLIFFQLPPIPSAAKGQLQ